MTKYFNKLGIYIYFISQKQIISGVIANWDIRSRRYKVINKEFNFGWRFFELLIWQFTVHTKQNTKFRLKNTKILTNLRSQNVFLFTVVKIWVCVYYTPMFLEYSNVTTKASGKKGHATLAKWLLEFLGIPRNKGVNFHSKFGLGIPRNS